MILLKQVLQDYNLVQAELSRAVSFSPATISQLLNHGLWPKRPEKKEEIKQKIAEWLTSKGISFSDSIFNEVAEGCNPQSLGTTSPKTEDIDMVLRKQVLDQETRKAFGLFKDPFAEPNCSDDLSLSPDARYVREALYAATKHSDFIAVVGESGSGKSTIRKDLKARIQKENAPVIVIEPYVLAMEDNDIKGKTLKSTQIVDAIMAEIAPTVSQPRSIEAKFRQLHKFLRESAKIGNHHMLIIEEAHSLPLPTLKHLKRFYELESDGGFSKLLSIVLIGQTELKDKLSEANPSVREVVQRCAMVTLNPLDTHLEEFLKHRFARANKKLSDVMSDDAIQALQIKLTSNRHGRSNLYPLVIQNTVIAAMKEAVACGETLVTADVVKAV